MTVLGVTSDPDGRRVEPTLERWTHITDPRMDHPELAEHQAALLRAIRAPDAVQPGRRANERWYFLRAPALPAGSRWS